MNIFADHPVVSVGSPLDGDYGLAVYLGPPGVDDADCIRFRRMVCFAGGQFPLDVSGEWNAGGELLGASIAGLVKAPADTIVINLPAGYLSTVFWAQVRPHDHGLELDTLFQPQRVVSSSGTGVPQIDGQGTITLLRPLDNGGVEVRFDWFPAVTGIPPVEFVVRRISGPSSPADVVVPAAARVAVVSGLTDGVYAFALLARNGASVITLATATVTADTAGPAAATGLEADER